ncbi:pub3, partial [Symbiodinium sp. KB8]
MASASQADLPAPWEQHEDDEGQPYYWNSETGEASWVHPADKADDLPFGWEELEDDSGNKYYFNHETGESQWHKPADQDPELVSLNTNLPEGWEALRDDDENVYYFNFTTEESTWDRPADAGPPGEIKAEDTTAAVAAAAEAAAKGAVLPDRKAARRHSVAKAMILQSKRAPRMLMPMVALAEGGEEEGEEGDAAKPAATGPSPKEQAANRKASMLAKESIVTDAAVKVWLKVSDNGKFWRRRFCTYIPEARSIFLY